MFSSTETESETMSQPKCVDYFSHVFLHSAQKSVFFFFFFFPRNPTSKQNLHKSHVHQSCPKDKNFKFNFFNYIFVSLFNCVGKFYHAMSSGSFSFKRRQDLNRVA